MTDDDDLAIAAAMVQARTQAGMTQEQVAASMQTSQAAVARLESGKGKPTYQTLLRFAHATGTRLRIRFEPIEPPRQPSLL